MVSRARSSYTIKGRLNIRKAKQTLPEAEANRLLAEKRAKWAKARAQSRAKKGRQQGQAGGYIRAKAKRLLKDWANTPDPPEVKRLAWLVKRHPEVFGDFMDHPVILLGLFREINHRLRDAWEESDLARRQWWLFEARRQHETARNSLGFGVFLAARTIPCPPEDTMFNQVMVCVQEDLAHTMQVCGNPNCPAPYFFKREKASKYCSKDCSAWGKGDSKRRWEEHNRPT